MKTVSFILVVVSAILLILALTRKNSNYMNVGAVIKSHICMIKTVPIQFLAIFVSPALLAVASVINGRISDALMENLVVAVSIFFSIFFAIMSILCSMIRKEDARAKSEHNDSGAKDFEENYGLLLSETFNCTMFESIISVFLLILLIGLQLFPISCSVIEAIFHCIILYLVFLVITNLLIIIKRLENLFNQDNPTRKNGSR